MQCRVVVSHHSPNDQWQGIIRELKGWQRSWASCVGFLCIEYGITERYSWPEDRCSEMAEYGCCPSFAQPAARSETVAPTVRV